jgi:hypothetical protein
MERVEVTLPQCPIGDYTDGNGRRQPAYCHPYVGHSPNRVHWVERCIADDFRAMQPCKLSNIIEEHNEKLVEA